MPSNQPTKADHDAIIEKSKEFRRFLMTTSGRWSRRSGVKRAADIICDELDELAAVITGNRDALLDPMHRTP